MHRVPSIVALTVLLCVAGRVSAQSSVFDFEDGTDQGFGLKFGNDASNNFTVTSVGGSMRMLVPRTGGFQEADHGEGATGSNFYNAMLAASSNEAGYDISYDYYIDTANFGTGAGTFFQMGTYLNTGSGYYAQDFGAVKELELSGAQLASGQIFQGTVTVNMAAAGFDMPTGETFFRLGFIENGDGAAQNVYLDNIRVFPVPEPASLGLLALLVPTMARRRRA
jgi:hypothetical protein